MAAFADRDALQTAIGEWLHRTDTASVAPQWKDVAATVHRVFGVAMYQGLTSCKEKSQVLCSYLRTRVGRVSVQVETW